MDAPEYVHVVIREEGLDVDSPVLWDSVVPLGSRTTVVLVANERRPNAAAPTVVSVHISEAIPRRLRTYPPHSHDRYRAGETCPTCGHVFDRDYGR